MSPKSITARAVFCHLCQKVVNTFLVVITLWICLTTVQNKILITSNKIFQTFRFLTEDYCEDNTMTNTWITLKASIGFHANTKSINWNIADSSWQNYSIWVSKCGTVLLLLVHRQTAQWGFYCFLLPLWLFVM